jgi:hypothetical protein
MLSKILSGKIDPENIKTKVIDINFSIMPDIT